jgi:ankyrin repeat protein
VNSLKDKTTPKRIRQALERLRKGSEASLDLAYQEAMERVESQDEGLRQLAKCALSWITNAKTPLTTSELRHALAVEIGESEFDKENLPDTEDIVSVCAGLVIIDEESDVIRLVHYTTQVYFERTQTTWFPDAQDDITKICVTYLSFDACGSDSFLNSAPDDCDYSLYIYASQNWGHHARETLIEADQFILDFLNLEVNVSNSIQILMGLGNFSGEEETEPGQMTGVHLAAYFGLERIIAAFLKQGSNLDLKDSRGITPLSWAARNGHGSVVKLLLTNDTVDLESKDRCGRTPLLWAMWMGQDAVIKLLLAKNVIDLDRKVLAKPLVLDSRIDLSYDISSFSWTPPSSLLTKILQELRATELYLTPLSWATFIGHESVVKLLLLEDGIDLNSKDTEYGRTPLWWAVRNANGEVVKLLLDKADVDPDSKDNRLQTPLIRAAANGHEGLVKLFLTKDRVNPNSKDKYGLTPLSWATWFGHEKIVELLLAKKDVDLNPKDIEHGYTPFSIAVANRNEALVKLLLDKEGVDPNPRDTGQGRTPLATAVANGNESLVKLLLAKEGVDLNPKDTKYGRTPLSIAVANGNREMVELLLAKEGVDLNPKDIKNDRTPLSIAVSKGNEALVKLLLDKEGVERDPNVDYNCLALSRRGSFSVASLHHSDRMFYPARSGRFYQVPTRSRRPPRFGSSESLEPYFVQRRRKPGLMLCCFEGLDEKDDFPPPSRRLGVYNTSQLGESLPPGNTGTPSVRPNSGTPSIVEH